MSTKILYFTGTGNSLYAAKRLAAGLNPVELIGMAGLPPTGEIRMMETERVGLVFPSYAFGLPKLVTEIVARLVVPETTFVFAVVTCGGHAGKTVPNLDNRLRERGIHLSAGFVLTAPGNYTPLAGAPPEEKTRTLLNRLDHRIDEILPDILAKTASPLESDWFLLKLFSPVVSAGFLRSVHGSDRKFRAEETCTFCGLCAKVCPVGNIRQTGREKPQWQGHCQQCMACLQYCPVEAIQFGWMTKGRRRYRNPFITIEEISTQKDSAKNTPRY
jgi:ferredoxin